MCQAKSQVPPVSVRVMPATINQMARGIETASAEDTSGRLSTGSAAGMLLACDILVTPFPCLEATLRQSNYRNGLNLQQDQTLGLLSCAERHDGLAVFFDGNLFAREHQIRERPRRLRQMGRRARASKKSGRIAVEIPLSRLKKAFPRLEHSSPEE